MIRQEFTKATKRAAFERANGCCETCRTKITTVAEYDHVTEAFLGGGNDLENCKVQCRKCHAAKTARNRPEIDKTRRIFEKRAGLRATAVMPGGRCSPWKKKINGEVERR